MAVGVQVGRLLGAGPRGAYEVLANLRLGLHHVAVLALANTYFVTREPALLPRAAANSLVLAAVLGGGFGVAALGAKALVPSWLAPATLAEAAPFFAAGPAIVGAHLVSGALLGAGRLRAWNAAIVANRLLVATALLAMLAWPPLRSLGVVLATLAAGEALGLGVALAGLRGTPGPVRPDWALLRRMAGFGLVASLHVLLVYLGVRADSFLLERLRGADELGQYAAASLLRDVVLFFPWIASLLVLPRVAGDPGDRGRHTRALAAPALAIAAALAAALWVAGPWLVTGLYGDAFAAAGPLVRVLVPGGFLLGVSHLLFQDLLGRGAPRAVLWIPAAGLVLLVAADLVLVPRHGALAAAWVALGSAALVCSLAAVAFLRHSRPGSVGSPPGPAR